MIKLAAVTGAPPDLNSSAPAGLLTSRAMGYARARVVRTRAPRDGAALASRRAMLTGNRLEEIAMQSGRPPVSTETRLYGMFLHAPEQRALVAPALFNALIDQHGIDAMFMPLQVTAEQLAPAIAGMRRLRDFAGFCVTMPHKAAVAQLCDVLLPNAQPVASSTLSGSTRMAG
jgi:shikimate dehydrogenase-like protein